MATLTLFDGYPNERHPKASLAVRANFSEKAYSTQFIVVNQSDVHVVIPTAGDANAA
jgi:hypothetical protein